MVIHDRQYVVVVIDDDQYVLDFLKELLEEHGLRVVPFSDGFEAMNYCQNEDVDVVVSDIRMPRISGIQLLETMHEFDSDLPVILVTAYADLGTAVEAIKQKAFDFLIKPFKADLFINAVERALTARMFSAHKENTLVELERAVNSRTAELTQSLEKVSALNREMIQRLCIAAEKKDDDTGAHISRIASYVFCLAKEYGLPEDEAQAIAMASPMHDIGKIGIPDAILFKKGPLTGEEFDVLKNHTSIGQRILEGSSFDLLTKAASIALNHHERWDGTGYPQGLVEKEIPLDGRLVIIADQYDALRSHRPYKEAFNHEKTYQIIAEGDGRTMPCHFDPDVLAAFKRCASEFDAIAKGEIDYLATKGMNLVSENEVPLVIPDKLL